MADKTIPDFVFPPGGEKPDMSRDDLAAVAELKTRGDGTIEVKFIDRVRALEALCELLSDNGDGALELFRALEDAGEEAL